MNNEKVPAINEALHQAYAFHKERVGAHGGNEVAVLFVVAEANLQAAFRIEAAIDRLTKTLERIEG